jgi:hypothetical protein
VSSSQIIVQTKTRARKSSSPLSILTSSGSPVAEDKETMLMAIITVNVESKTLYS